MTFESTGQASPIDPRVARFESQKHPWQDVVLRGSLRKEIEDAPFTFEGDELQYFLSLCEYYSTELRSLVPLVPANERGDNIRRVNLHQEGELKRQSNLDVHLGKSRRLNLYFRTGSDGRTQMDPFEFSVITWILNWYIHQGHSKVFNSLSVVSRLENDYPHLVHSIAPKIQYINLSGEQFQKACALGANTIHLTHGSVIENEYASTPILGQSTREDSVVMATCDRYVPLQLYYPEGQRPNNRDLKLHEIDYSGSFATIMSETIRSVRALEEKMLSEAGGE